MPAKKASRKKTKRPSRQQLIIIAIAVIIGGLLMITTLQATKQQKLEREDREKFSKLETKMEDLKTELTKQGLGKWKIEKGCEKPSVKYNTSNEGVCRLSMLSPEANFNSIDKFKTTLNSYGSLSTEKYSDYSKKFYADYSFGIDGIYCSLYFGKNNESINELAVSCRGIARDMYYQ